MLLTGTISDDNGRKEIWNAAIDMIKTNPFGYGAMGTRHVIYFIHDVGHPHQVFLEILVDFGVLLGSIIIIIFIYQSAKILFSNKYNDWFPIYVLFFCRSCQLLLSGTFWHVAAIWACIGIIFICSNKKRSRTLYVRI